MRRAYALLIAALLAGYFASRRPGREPLRYRSWFADPSPSTGPGEDRGAAPLPPPERVLLESSRALFSRPAGGGGSPSGADLAGRSAAGPGEAGGARAAAALGRGAQGPGEGGGRATAAREGAAEAEAVAGEGPAGTGSAGEGGRRGPGATRSAAGAPARAPREGGGAFDGGRGLLAGSAGPGAEAAGGSGPRSGPGGVLLGALSRWASGGDAAAGRAPQAVEGRPVSGDAGAPGLSLGGAGAGGSPDAVEGRAVEGPPSREPAPLPEGIARVEPVAGEPRPAELQQAPGSFAPDKGKAPTLTTGAVRREGAKNAVVFDADMDIDADGAGGWHLSDRTGQPSTSLRYSDGQSLNPGRIPFVVVPTDFNRTHPEVRLGDYAVVSYKGRSVFAIVGDKGPAGVLGEASIAAAASLGINPDPIRGGVDSGVRYVIFPGTADREPPAEAAPIQKRGAELLQQNELKLR